MKAAGLESDVNMSCAGFALTGDSIWLLKKNIYSGSTERLFICQAGWSACSRLGTSNLHKRASSAQLLMLFMLFVLTLGLVEITCCCDFICGDYVGSSHLLFKVLFFFPCKTLSIFRMNN